MSLTVPRFILKNKTNTNPQTNADLNQSSWRHLYRQNSTNPVDTAPASDSPDLYKQLPWLTLYKHHRSLLQIKLVTTIGYVQSHDGTSLNTQAVFIKGFPLMVQGPISQFNNQNDISSEDWEFNWPFYKEHVEDFSGNLTTEFNNNWSNFSLGNNQVITDMKFPTRRNLLILDLNDQEFVLKTNGKAQRKFYVPDNNNNKPKNYNGKERPEYLVVRLDTAEEETTFASYNADNSLNKSGVVTINNNFSDSEPSSATDPPRLLVFNYVYHGHVISPYDFMAAFTTDYLRGLLNINNELTASFINKNLNNVNDPNVIQINSRFFSATHSLKDGWDNSRKNSHEKIKTPFYYNFFLQITTLDIKNINTSDSTEDRFKTIGYSATALAPEEKTNGATNSYYIEKLFWSSLTSPRHTQYSGNVNNDKGQRAFIGNFLRVNEVQASYENNQRIFLNSNADYMPTKTVLQDQNGRASFEPCGYIEREIGSGSSVQYSGKNEINMCRKTLTPYYYPNYQQEAQYSKYAFNWSDPTKTWNEIAGENGGNLSDEYGIVTNSNAVDISNCVVIELRSLVDFKPNTEISVDFELNNQTDAKFNNPAKKTITFLDSRRYVNNTTDNQYFTHNATEPIWKNGVRIVNNSVFYHSSENARDISRFENNQDKFRVYWDSAPGGLSGASDREKFIYVIDIASGSYDVSENSITISDRVRNNDVKDTFLPSSWDDHKEIFKFKANVYQIKINTSDQNGNINREDGEFLNFSLDGNQQQVSIYNEPRLLGPVNVNDNFTGDERPIFGYFNFFGLTSSEFIGGEDWHRGGGTNNEGEEPIRINYWLSFVLTNIEPAERNRLLKSPYYLLTNGSRFRPNYRDVSKLYFNSNIFYGATNFAFSNVYAKTLTTDLYTTRKDSNRDILFVDKTTGPLFPAWRNTAYKTDGLDITSLSTDREQNFVTNKRFFVDKTGVEIFNGTIFGKFDINNRTFHGTTNNDTEPPCIELNEEITLSNDQKTLKPACLNFYKVAFVASQKNLFISDYWKWKERLVSLTIPEESYNGIIPIGLDIVDRSLNNRYNIYNWKANDIPSNLYPSTNVHTPQRAFENQSLINFSVEVSTISFNVSHILINTWAGNLDNNNNLNQQSIVGLSSFSNSNGEYDIISGSPKLTIAGGLSVSPNIEINPVYLKFDIHGQLNFATDKTIGNISDEEKSKAPSEIVEANGNLINFGENLFGVVNGGVGPPDGGWFTHLRPNLGINKQIGRNGIFVPMADANGNNPTERFYSTRDFSADALQITPTNITINTTTYPGDGGFRKEEQKFPLELLFCYPFSIPDNIPKPNKLITTYNNSDGEQTNVTFNNYKGNKRFSKLYALKIRGDNIEDTNINFRDRTIFPETILVNCVELPPPVQVNNFNDMLASDNSEVKLVWKGYNFDFSSGNARSQLGNVGNIIWKIVRFQTQLEIRKTIFEGEIIPTGGNSSNGFNLSTYVYKDKDIRIYDKYEYTVSGTYKYDFLRTNTDTRIYTLEMPFGSFTTQELIVCKNNKFEFGRYNTTSTNLKLFRPLLINKKGGQKDEYGRQTAGGLCLGNIFSGSTRISSSQNIYANTTNQITKKQTYVLLARQGSISGFR